MLYLSRDQSKTTSLPSQIKVEVRMHMHHLPLSLDPTYGIIQGSSSNNVETSHQLFNRYVMKITDKFSLIVNYIYKLNCPI